MIISEDFKHNGVTESMMINAHYADKQQFLCKWNESVTAIPLQLTGKTDGPFSTI